MEIVMPKVGLTMTEGTLAQWHKREGEAVHKGEVLFTFESEKSTLEYESPADGVLARVLVQAGQTVPCLTPVAILEPHAPVSSSASDLGAAEHAALRCPISPRARMRAAELGVDLTQVQGSGPAGAVRERDVLRAAQARLSPEPAARATPIARKLAESLGIDLGAVQGSGPEGKITREDVLRAARAQSTKAQAAPSSTAHAPVVEPLTSVRRITAQRLSESARSVPQVTLFTEADAAQLVAAREQISAELGEKASYNTLLILICARALREHPLLNASWAGDETPGIVMHQQVNVALAVDTPRGLLTPVVRDADKKPLRVLHTELSALVKQAQAGTLPPDALQGGTFTLTNLGMFDVDGFTPIVNPPQAAILGVGRIRERAVPQADGRIVARATITLSLSFDHRVVDGAPAARFLQRVKQLIERPFALMV
ncbi:MAG: 2-oxo acid dehydrogenase subunit E2 [Thermoflexales bacterium]|nr:2-oxo acid dehydrogenase subunit E2 [Thermoflexales bacterium]MDW8292170.1 dihydrolipoamide acetyltransferase family protein [Anaerolineae bacterium]